MMQLPCFSIFALIDFIQEAANGFSKRFVNREESRTTTAKKQTEREEILKIDKQFQNILTNGGWNCV